MNNVIKYYDWVLFFGAICNKITEFSKDIANREKKLLEIAQNTFLPDHAILQCKTTDPFSFIYALAQRNTKNQRIETFSRAKKAFELDEDIPTDYVYPTPTPNTLSLFFFKGGYVNKESAKIGNKCLWDLFDQVISDNDINEEDFREVLSLKNVGFTKLSQAMFLMNPKKYAAFDTQMNSLPIPELGDLKQVVSKIETSGISVYLQAIDKLKAAFPGCELYEINLLNVLINSNDNDQLKVSNNYCQISSWAYGQRDNDYFQDFINKNAVWTGDKESTNGAKTYPITNFKRGDLVLVRRGTKNLGGIAIVLENEYIPNGFDYNKSIKVIWLVKQDKKIEDDALGQWDGFSHASDKTIRKFKESYPSTFSFLESIRKNQNIMINHSAEKYKNLILQGPPGTGKTRLAKQIAEWLTSEVKKDYTLIQAIDNQIFQKDPDIEDNERVKLIQFHPSYTYEDFVRGIKVDAAGEKINYDVENRFKFKRWWITK